MNGPDGKRFVWGKIVDIHSIGRYDIVEFVWKDIRGPLSGRTGFAVYVGQEDIGVSAPTLDGALLLAIAYRAEVSNTQAAHYMAKMIGLKTDY